MSRKYSVLFAALILLTAGAVSVAPNHPLSAIRPMDTILDLNGTSIHDVDELLTNDTAGSHLIIRDNVIDHSSNAMFFELDAANTLFRLNGVDTSLEGNSLVSTDQVTFTDDNSDSNVYSAGERTSGDFVIRNTNTASNIFGINPSGDVTTIGNFSTGSATGFVNGANMYGALNMNSNRIEGLGASNSGDDAMRKDTIQSTFVARAGDSMSGTLDMTGNNVLNGALCPDGSCSAGNEFFDSNGLHAANIYSGSGASVNFQDAVNFNSYSVSNLRLGDTLDAGSNRLTNLADPTNAQDAVTRSYLSSQMSGQTLSDVLANGNSAGTYTIDMNGNQIGGLADGTASSDAITVGQVDNDYVARAGDTMTGNLDMNGNNILNPNLVDGVDLDATGNALTIDGSNHYAVSSNSIGNSELANSESFTVGGLTANGVVYTNGNRLDLDSGQQMITIHDGNGNFNIKSGVDQNQNIVAGTGGTHVTLTESGGFDVSVDESTAEGSAMSEDIGFAVNGGGVEVRSGALNMNSNRIEGLGAANSGDDAMRRDNIQAQFVERAGDSMTGNLDMGGSNVLNGALCPDGTCSSGNEYFDAGGLHTTNIYSGSGGEIDIQSQINFNSNSVKNIAMTTALDMGSNQIDNVADPTESQDAATKSYVDTQTSNAETTATQNLQQVLSEGNSAASTPIVNVGANNIDIGDGQGNLDMNGQRIVDGGLVQVSGLGVTGSLSTAETEVTGNSLYVQDDISVDGNIIGAGGDVAELIHNESRLESGTVVQISGEMSVDKTDEKHDTQVAGVVSTDPAMIMAKDRDGVPVVMTGTAPVKVTMENGPIRPGDMLTTSSTPGYAMKCNDLEKCTGSIIGKAMESQDEKGKVVILISRG